MASLRLLAFPNILLLTKMWVQRVIHCRVMGRADPLPEPAKASLRIRFSKRLERGMASGNNLRCPALANNVFNGEEMFCGDQGHKLTRRQLLAAGGGLTATRRGLFGPRQQSGLDVCPGQRAPRSYDGLCLAGGLKACAVWVFDRPQDVPDARLRQSDARSNPTHAHAAFVQAENFGVACLGAGRADPLLAAAVVRLEAVEEKRGHAMAPAGCRRS